MSTFDIFLLMIILASAVFGLFRGLFKEVFSLVILIGAYFVATYFAPSLSGALASEVGTGTLGYGVSFGMLFLGTLLVGGIINFLVGKVLSSSGLSGFDRFFGFAFGAVRGALLCLAGLIAAKSFIQGTDFWASSEIAPMLLAYEDVALDLFGRAGQAVGDLQDAVQPPAEN